MTRHVTGKHNQPKEVATELANQSAADYLKKATKKKSLKVPISKVNSVVIATVIRKNAAAGSSKTIPPPTERRGPLKSLPVPVQNIVNHSPSHLHHLKSQEPELP